MIIRPYRFKRCDPTLSRALTGPVPDDLKGLARVGL